MDSFTVFKLLMWKNGVSVKNSLLPTILRLAMPIIFILCVILMRHCGKPIDELHFKPFTTDQKSGSQVCLPKNKAYVVIFSPQSDLLEGILSKVCHGAEIQSYESSSKLEQEVTSNTNLSRFLLLAVKFSDEMKGIKDTKNLPANMQITLRLPSLDEKGNKQVWITGVLYPLKTPGARLPKENVDDIPEYQKRGFLYLQQAITASLINYGVKNDTSLDLKLKIQKFSYPKWSGDLLYSKGIDVFLVTLMLGFALLSITSLCAIDIVKEKELQLKASMRLLGVPRWILWCSYFAYFFIISAIVSLLTWFLLTFKIIGCPVLPNSNKAIFLIFCLITNCATVTFGFLISTIFTKTSTALALADNLQFISLLPFMLNMSKFMGGSPISVIEVLTESLLVGTGVSYGIVGFLRLENEGGIQWSTLWKTTIQNDGISVGSAYVMLIIDTVIYMLLTLYIEAVFPGPFETSLPWNFFYTKSYWTGTIKAADSEDLSADDQTLEKENFEAVTENRSKGVEIIGVTKVYGSNTVVNNLNFDIYEGQITALLGHNGAGKTTTVSMICGLVQPTKGTIKVYGHDIRTKVDNVHKLIGLCPQQNVLFEYMTVRNHLFFFCRLKGASPEKAKQQVNMYLKLLDLQDKENVTAVKLSGGMKRKLSIGIAMCGDSKLVVLDEPTAALDPAARRVIWNLIQSQREGKTILLITHFMDEADILGDRIAIMTAGKLECCGTSFFLKKNYSAGYYLTLEVTPNCNPQVVTDLVKFFVSSCKLHSQVGTEITYELPDEDSSKFPDLLLKIEQEMNELEIQSYGISPASLEEVFLKVGGHQNIRELKTTSPKSYTTLKSKSGLYLSGINLWKSQIAATFAKRIIYLYRTWYLYLLTQIIIPIGLVLWVMLSHDTHLNEKMFEPLTITLDDYNNPITLLCGNKNEYYDIYEKGIGNHKVKKVDDCTEEILSELSSSYINVIERYIVAVNFDKNTATAMFNSVPYHSPPLALALLLNTMYMAKFGSSRSVTFVNEPLPVPAGVKEIAPIMVTQALIYTLFPIVSVVVLFKIKEKVTGFKHLQLCSGLNPLIYWLVSFVFDFTLYFLAMVAVFIVALILGENIFVPPERAQIIFIIIAFFGVFIISLSYLLSTYFTTNESASTIIALLWVGGMVGMIVYSVQLEDLVVLQYIEWILIFTPFYSLGTAFLVSETVYNTKQTCMKLVSLETACKLEPLCCVTDYYAMNRSGIGRQILVSFCMGILLILIVLFIDFNYLRMLWQFLFKGKGPQKSTSLENDVKKEKIQILLMEDSDLKKTYILVLKNVTKYYGKLLAVNDLCVGVKPYECLGLLGANGAGKTTTFEMMNGKNIIPYGDILIGGYSLKTDVNKVREMIGYCPQFDALFDEFTTEETLVFFALIHGIPSSRIKETCNYYAEILNLAEHMNKKVSELSGGNKRKLSVSVALMGSPLLFFLDEPTGAMDPAAKRNVWNALAKARDEGKSIVLTSHSMEECEVLCTRIAIMVKGEFMCLGSTQRLKRKFAQGYNVKIKIEKNSDLDYYITEIVNYMEDKFPRTKLEERYQELLTFKINASIQCSEIFRNIEEVKYELCIEDYSVQQCSLEQVFLSLTNDDNE